MGRHHPESRHNYQTYISPSYIRSYVIANKKLVNGLSARRYSDSNLKNVVKTSELLNVNFSRGGKNNPIKKQLFSVDFEGQLKILQSGKHEFKISGRDGFRLFIDGKKIIDAWQNSPPPQKGSINLDPGLYNIKIEYYNTSKRPFLSLTWKTPAFGQFHKISACYFFRKHNN